MALHFQKYEALHITCHLMLTVLSVVVILDCRPSGSGAICCNRKTEICLDHNVRVSRCAWGDQALQSERWLNQSGNIHILRDQRGPVWWQLIKLGGVFRELRQRLRPQEPWTQQVRTRERCCASMASKNGTQRWFILTGPEVIADRELILRGY